MPVLSNPKHERFAQELAAGKPADAAYVAAGFKPNRGNATTLKQKQSILERVSELLAEREKLHGQATARAVERLSITKEWVLGQLVENANRAMQAVPVTVGGAETGEYRYEGSVANRSLELIGKELGMFIDRKEQGAPGEFAELDNSGALAAAIAARLAMARSGDETAGLAGAQGSGRGKPH